MSINDLQLINGKCEIAPIGDITSFLSCNVSKIVNDNANLNTIGTNYRVVGIFGRQSSGKSTLLNSVFGTSFREMDPTKGRSQTTLGVFLSVVANTSKRDNVTVTDPLLVCDFEGTDGVEKSNDQLSERRLSLFALTIVDTLIINMFATDIGCFNAANLSLLRTVFEENLKLCSKERSVLNGSSEKPTLLFVMRDLENLDFFENNCKSLRLGIDHIWSEINKPKGLEKCDIEGIFNVRYFAFSHYKYQNDQFLEEVKKFRVMFGLPEEGRNCKDMLNFTINPVFASRSNYRKIPMEVLHEYLSNCWTLINNNQDLDIPSQRVLVSKVRCGKLIEQKKNSFYSFAENTFKDIENFIEKKTGKYSGLSASEVMLSLKKECSRLVEEFTEETKLYSNEIVTEYREMLDKEFELMFKYIQSQFEAFSMTHCKVLFDHKINEFSSSVENKLSNFINNCKEGNNEDPCVEFMERLDKENLQILDEFVADAKLFSQKIFDEYRATFVKEQERIAKNVRSELKFISKESCNKLIKQKIDKLFSFSDKLLKDEDCRKVRTADFLQRLEKECARLTEEFSTNARLYISDIVTEHRKFLEGDLEKICNKCIEDKLNKQNEMEIIELENERKIKEIENENRIKEIAAERKMKEIENENRIKEIENERRMKEIENEKHLKEIECENILMTQEKDRLERIINERQKKGSCPLL